MSRRPLNPNFLALRQWYDDPTIVGGILEGSSRSRKTWSALDFLIYLTSRRLNEATIAIVKETYNSFKTSLYDDFNRRLPNFGIPSPFADKKEVSTFWLNGSRVMLLGADSETVLQGVGTDIVYFNEMLEISKEAFDQMKQRCRGFWFGDYNPKFVKHPHYDISKRSDVGFLKTTFKDNPYISKNELNEILGYQAVKQSKIAMYYIGGENDELKQKILIDKARKYDTWKNINKFPEEDLIELRRCVRNEIECTANPYKWTVMGLGERCSPEGQVFPNVTWISKFPDNIERIYYGLDFGFTVDPSTVVRIGVKGNPADKTGEIYLEKLHYGPTLNAAILGPILEMLGLKTKTMWADSSEPGMIADLSQSPYKMRVYGVKKFPGSINYGVGLLQKYKMFIVDCSEWREEQSQYIFAKVNGVPLDEPIDAYNHLWDAARYAAMSNLR